MGNINKTFWSINNPEDKHDEIKRYVQHITNQYKLEDKEQKAIERGKKYWTDLNVLNQNKGGYVSSDTIKKIIDIIVDDVWKNAKEFYNNIDSNIDFNSSIKYLENLLEDIETDIDNSYAYGDYDQAIEFVKNWINIDKAIKKLKQ